jgi:2-C-methyl-D-erythritol 4-phosphate cytidylyltransferase/2-C-methyl-D-erythritol 2,4-cyclodiphosphate synthase
MEPVSVIIAAAGKGRRFGSIKTFFELFGYPLLYFTLLPFEKNERIDEIILLVPPGKIEEGLNLKKYFRKIKEVKAGGEERGDTVKRGVEMVKNELVLVHDGARPLVSSNLIERVMDALRDHPAVVPVIPLRDTIKEKEGGFVKGILERDRFVAVQTPQGFRREILKEAYKRAEETGFRTTDDSSLVEKMLGIPSFMVRGEEENIKVTFRGDIDTVKKLIGKDIRIGFGYDIHRLEKGRKLIVGGVEITTDFGAVGHSDGDVLIHSIIDSLLGGASLGDIGQHFPDTDQALKGISSLKLLERTSMLLRERGVTIVNIDTTVLLEEPKILPHVEEMKEKISEVLNIKRDRISIKGKRGEGMDSVGRGEAIASYSTALLLILRY